jgi:putative ABC transport system permease protein
MCRRHGCAWREQGAGIQELAVYASNQHVNLSVAGRPRQAAASHVTASFFRFFGARPARGRFYTDDEDRPGAAPVAVLSRGFWLGHLGADQDVVGKTISVNGELATVVGVLDEPFDAQSLGPGIIIPAPTTAPL